MQWYIDMDPYDYLYVCVWTVCVNNPLSVRMCISMDTDNILLCWYEWASVTGWNKICPCMLNIDCLDSFLSRPKSDIVMKYFMWHVASNIKWLLLWFENMRTTSLLLDFQHVTIKFPNPKVLLYYPDQYRGYITRVVYLLKNYHCQTIVGLTLNLEHNRP